MKCGAVLLMLAVLGCGSVTPRAEDDGGAGGGGGQTQNENTGGAAGADSAAGAGGAVVGSGGAAGAAFAATGGAAGAAGGAPGAAGAAGADPCAGMGCMVRAKQDFGTTGNPGECWVFTKNDANQAPSGVSCNNVRDGFIVNGADVACMAPLPPAIGGAWCLAFANAVNASPNASFSVY